MLHDLEKAGLLDSKALEFLKKERVYRIISSSRLESENSDWPSGQRWQALIGSLERSYLFNAYAVAVKKKALQTVASNIVAILCAADGYHHSAASAGSETFTMVVEKAFIDASPVVAQRVVGLILKAVSSSKSPVTVGPGTPIDWLHLLRSSIVYKLLRQRAYEVCLLLLVNFHAFLVLIPLL